jgi:class 3 adenylate cyclase
MLKMGLAEELRKSTQKVLAERWTARDGTVVPGTGSVGLSNDGIKFESATVLYADLADSTDMVASQSSAFAAEVYKTFLYCCARTIRSESGEITAYDGDRVMAVYLGDYKNQSAARTALKINYAVTHIINPAIEKQYPDVRYRVRHVVGIDTSALLVARTGVRGDNDLVWVGRAPNYAAKLTTLPATHTSRITEDVYNRLPADLKVNGNPPASLWEKVTWRDMKMTIYRSTSWWRID